MFRGLISGIFWGAIVVAGVLALVSLLAPLPATVIPQTDAVEPSVATETGDAANIGNGSQADQSVSGVESPQVATESDGDQPPLADTESAPQPEVGNANAGMTAPDTGESAPQMATDGTSDPAIPDASTTAPVAPSAEAAPVADEDLSITTNPAQPVAPAVPDTGGAFDNAATEPQDPPLINQDEVFETPEAPEPQEDAEQEDADMTPSAESEEASAAEPQEGESLLKPATDLKQTFPQHESTRLPTVGGDSENAASEVAKSSTRPFDVNAAAYDVEAGKPIMSVVLIDDGSVEVDVQALASFPYPLTFAVNTLAADVADRVAMYRGMDYEVLAMIDIPGAAAAGDVEVALDAHLAAIPDAVGVLEGTGEGLQGSKVVSDQVRAVLLNTGHGLVMFPKGLNTAQKLASKDGVPAATVFRDFDSKGQNAAVIRRFLDQAAFKAGQEGGVVMIGRVREETISALLLWGLQDRASTVSLAPVSALLRSKEN